MKSNHHLLRDLFFKFKGFLKTMNYDKRIRLAIRLKSPVLMTDVPGDQNLVETKLYLTGSSIMGIFANKYIEKKNGIADDFFYKSFLCGGLTFTDAFKEIDDGNGGSVPAYILPLSVQKKKHDESGDCVEYFIEPEESEKQENDGMKNKFRPVGGFGNINNGSVRTVRVGSGISFHGAINNGKRDNDIFNYEWIAPFQSFISYVVGSEGYLKVFLDFVNEICQPSAGSEKRTLNVYIGRSRTAEYGRIEIVISDMENIPATASSGGDNELCIMTLLSDTIIYNEDGFSTTDVDDLKKAIGPKVEIKESAIRKSAVENFIGKWSARKPMENVFLAGSSFLIRCDTLPENYKDMEIYGIGERTNEGFGRVFFNLNARRKLTKKESGRCSAIDIHKTVTGTAKKIIERRIIDSIKDQLAADAIEQANKADNGRVISGSLSSKLREFARGMKEINDFNDKLGKLRETAKRKLDDASTENVSMHDFLRKFGNENHIKDKVNNVLESSGIKDFIGKINSAAGAGGNSAAVTSMGGFLTKDNLIKFQRIYLRNFFTQLKRKNKKGRDKKGRQDEKK